MDRKQVVWPQFPAGAKVYDLTTFICPCGDASVKLDNTPIRGEVRTAQSQDSPPESSAFLAFSETWIGPFEPDEETAI